MWGNCLEGVGRLSGGIVEAVWLVLGGYLKDVEMLFGGCGDAIKRCGKAVWMV